MGLWSWIFGAPAKVHVDFTRLDDAKLQELWSQRVDLTDEARELVRAECIERGFKLKGLKRKAKPDRIVVAAPEIEVVPLVNTDNILSVDGPAVALRTTAGRWALVLLPAWDPDAVIPDLKLDAIIVCNQELRGWLATSALAAKAGVPAERIWAITDGPIDRAPEQSGNTAMRFPDQLVLGALTLRRHRSASDVLYAAWKGSKATVAIGPAFPEAALEGVKIVACTLPLPSVGWKMHLLAATSFAAMDLVNGTRSGGLQILIAGAAVGYPLSWHLPGGVTLGITECNGECPVIPDAVEALGCLLRGCRERVPTTIPSHVSADLVDHLLIEERLDDAAWLCDHVTSDPHVLASRGTVHALAGEIDQAIDCYERSNAFAPLAQVLISRGEHDRALKLAVTSLADMQHDALALDATVRALWHLGKLEEANAILAETPIRTRRLDALYELIGNTPGTPVLVFPTLADRAYRRAARTGNAALRVRSRRLEGIPDAEPIAPAE